MSGVCRHVFTRFAPCSPWRKSRCVLSEGQPPRDQIQQHRAGGRRQRALTLAKTPFEGGRDFLLEVLDARVQGAELALRASQSALLHQGARGYLMSAAPQRRIREAHFVAIVTPAIKHLRWEMARLMREEIPS